MSKLILPALLALASFPFPAVAQSAQRDVHIAYRDLDLSTPEGVAELDRRIAQTVKAVCPPDDSLELSRRAIVKRCHHIVAAAIADQRTQAIASMKDRGSAIAAR